tara:strand:+ start:91 stop:741 length:651 start_codon:yes stop_codon:yes gene_type:complete
MTTLAWTIAPSLIILAYIIKSDRFKEPTGLKLWAFFVGILLIIPAGYLNSILVWPTGNIYIAGLTEEICKFLALYYLFKNRQQFNEPMDAIVYGVLISMGFATLENFEYVYIYSEANLSLITAILRAFTAIPMHATCAVIMGYYLGMYIFRLENFALFKAIVYPVIFHGVYNLLVQYVPIVWLFWLIFMISFAVRLHKRFIFEQKLKNVEDEKKLI